MGEAESLDQMPQSGLDGSVGDVPAVPTQKYIHFVGAGESDVRGVAVGSGRQKPRGQNFAGEFLHVVGHLQQRNGLQGFQPELSHRFFAKCDFIKNYLRREKFVFLTLQIPPIAGELLACGLQEVASGTRNDVARYRALDVDAHVVQLVDLTLTRPAATLSHPMGEGVCGEFTFENCDGLGTTWPRLGCERDHVGVNAGHARSNIFTVFMAAR